MTNASWSPEIVRGSDAADVAAVAALAIAASLHEAIAARGSASLVLAGGTTPKLVHRALAEDTSIAWKSVRIFVGDERAVAPSSPESNVGMVRETLLNHVRVPDGNVFFPVGDAVDLEAEAARYDSLLPDQVDVLLLGMGEDGHTASLFPGAPSLSEQSRKVLVIGGPKPPPTRLTITPPVLASARRTFVFATGASKAEVLSRALTTFEPQTLPVQLTHRVTLFADAAALSRIEELS